jgi:putative ABC transport system permease protein
MTIGTVDPPELAATAPGHASPPRRTGGWRPALRIARRSVRRNLGRSVLVAALVAVPVAGATIVDGVYRTTSAPEYEAYLVMADGDAVVEVTPYQRMSQEFVPEAGVMWGGSDELGIRDPADVDLAAMLPAGTVLVPAPVEYWGVRAVHGDGTVRSEVVVAELGHDLTQNRARLVSGAWPQRDDEVLVSEQLADRLELLTGREIRTGAFLRLHEGPTVTVTGIGIDPQGMSNETIFVAPGSAVDEHLAGQGEAGSNWRTVRYGGDAYIADLPNGTDIDMLWPELAGHGVATVFRESYLEPDRYQSAESSLYIDAEVLVAAGMIALVVGLGLLEVVLLAGAAFAVSARRQVRDLGLVASNGGTAGHVRRIVLAQGVVLGAAGAALGLAAGVAITIGARPLWERFGGSMIETWRFGPELAVAAAVGVLSGLAAAVVPAVGAARMRPVDALAERFRTTRLAARLPRLGVALIALGGGGALLGSRVAAGELADYARRIEEAAGSGLWVSQPPSVGLYVAVQLAGAVVAITGLIMVISFLVTSAARRMRRWPLSARFAARDAARHRHRTTPAVAAIMIVVAGATGLSFGLAGTERADELRYLPALPDHVMGLTSDLDAAAVDDSAAFTAAFSEVADQVAAMLPGSSTIIGAAPIGGVHQWPEGWTEVLRLSVAPADSWIQEHCQEECGYSEEYVSVATPELIELALGRAPDRATIDALAAGAAVVLSPDLVERDGTVTAHIFDYDGGDSEYFTLPAHLVDHDGPRYNQVPTAFVSAETAVANGWDVVTVAGFITFDATATADDIDAARDVADNLDHWAYVEGEHNSYMDFVYLGLIGGAALVTLIGVGVTVALAAAEGRADLATMAAVGAPPRRRRLIAGWQALVVGGLGTLLGVGLGTYYAYLIWPAIGAPEFIVPWRSIVLIGIAVPALAVVVAMTVTPSRLPLMRRLE